MTKKPVFQDNDFFIFECPHCDNFTTVHSSETNCRIFRHASYFQLLPHLPTINGKPQYVPTQPISPHTSQQECERLVVAGVVLGCAKPFRFVYSTEGNYVEVCDYI